MRILETPVSLKELKKSADDSYGGLVKAVVDIGRGLIAVNAELHSDLEALLTDSGSAREDLWGINLYPELPGDDFIEFDSMINLKPSQGNITRGVEDTNIRRLISDQVNKWITR